MRARRVTIVASELVGIGSSGGAGTMATNLALALGLAGHTVEVLQTGSPGQAVLDPGWAAEYAAAGVVIRGLEATETVVPSYLATTSAVLRSLRDDPPGVVIADDWLGRAYAPLQLRQAGAGFEATAFVIRCAGSLGWLAEVSGKVPADSVGRFAIDLTERASVALADAVVSPSAFVLDWMRARGWEVPEPTLVLHNFAYPAAVGVPPPPAPSGLPVQHLAFFGAFREGKGIRVFVDAVNALDPGLLPGVELVFVGPATARWSTQSIEAALDPRVVRQLAGIRFETALGQTEALDELRRPGTLAVMPYLLDNGPHAVAECIEHGIPFLASSTGGTPEVVAVEDRPRVLVEPTAAGLGEGFARVLTDPTGQAPAGYSRDPRQDVEAWLELLATIEPRPRRVSRPRARVGVIVPGPVAGRSELDVPGGSVEMIAASSRREGLRRADTDWVVFLDRGESVDDAALGSLVESLLAAQAASGADVVTCGIRGQDGAGRPVARLFLGSPGALGLLENCYGTVALVRRALIDPEKLPLESAADPDWPLLASLDLGGSRIVSVPEPLVDGDVESVGTVRDLPGEGLVVLRLFEASAAAALVDAPRLIAALAPARPRGPGTGQPASLRSRIARSRIGRLLRAVRR